MSSNRTFCDLDFSDILLISLPFQRTCRYHRKQGQKFQGNQLFPFGFCPHLYRVAYPYCLALLYDARFPASASNQSPQSFEIRCPAGKQNVQAKISIRYSYPALLRKLKKMTVKVLHALNIPTEYPDRNIFLEIIDQQGTCPWGLEKGSTALFNLKNRRELCPASFYNLYPALLKYASNIIKGKKESSSFSLNHCPDPYGVCYQTRGSGIRCEDFFTIHFEITSVPDAVSKKNQLGKIIKAEDKLPGEFCPLAFYSIYPYYITLIHGGWFEWVPSAKHVRVQCPQHDGIIMQIEKTRQTAIGDGAVKVRILKILGNCAKGHSEGDCFDFDSRKQGYSFKELAALIPLKMISQEDAIFSDPGLPPINNNFKTFKFTKK